MKTMTIFHIVLVNCFFLILIFVETSLNVSASVIGIDYGTDWYKVSIVMPGIPLDIVLNRESKRKTAATICFRDGIRYFGSDAINLVMPSSPCSV